MPRIPETAMHNVIITGPMWSAKVDILKLANPEQDWAFRTLFVDLTARDRLGQSTSLLPGTMIVLGVVRQVTIQLGNQPGSGYEWRRSEHLPVPTLDERSQTQLRDLITTGQCSLLLVQADPDGWPTQFPQRQPMSYFPTSLTCLAGEIFLGLGGLEAQGQAVEHLYTKLFLQLAVEAFEQRHGNDRTTVQPSRLLSQVSVHGSGLSLYGQVQLPWQADQIAAPFLLTRDFPQRYNHPILRLRPEKNRLTQEEVTSWVSAWNQLSGYLNPNHPLNKQVRADQLPQWVTLELTTPNQVPDLFWLFRLENALPKLRFEPDEFSLLVSDRPPYDGQNPPDSLARIAPAWVEIDGNGDSLTINFDTQPESIATASSAPEVDRLSYTYQVTESETGTQSEEFFSATELRTAFSPVEVPQFLRKIQGRPESDYALDDITISKPPQASAAQQGSDSDDQQNGTINPWLLWGFMPLQNGWAQLPFLNLTEQLYLDLDLDGAAASSEATQSLLQGAVALGNETVLSTYLDEQPWNLTLTDADRIHGNWKYGCPNARTNAQTNNSWVLRKIKLDIENPTAIFNGLLWLSTQAPRIIDAIPDLDNWVNGLQSFALRTARPDRDLFPSLMLMVVNLQFNARPVTPRVKPSAELANWQINYRFDERTIERFRPLLKLITGQEDLSSLFVQSPLIWQRHDHLPMVQALPLTQSQTPPNHPSASRQLVPYEIPLLQPELAQSEGLQFTATGANTWLRLVDANRDTLVSATEWKSQPDLPLVSLSLPGLQLVPSQSNHELVCQYRFDLPYTDEINAFAQLPEPPQNPEFVSPLPQSPPPEPPYPLIRDTYATHWRRLSERASLSSADGTLAFDLNDSANEQGKHDLQHLIEPYVWSVQPTFQLENYPGSLSLANSSTLELEGDSALKGISGQFAVNGRQLTRLENSAPNGSDTFAVTAGSLAAKLTPQGLHDQRGLVRGLTQMDKDESWLQTPVVFYKTAEQELAYALTTTAKPISLQVGNQQWEMWFRDLPLRLAQATHSETGQFLRQARLSPHVQDVNDPESRSRDFDFLSGYEWRIAVHTPAEKDPSEGKPLSYLPLFGLHFYPLTLEQVDLRQGKPERVIVIGRLQLPLREIKELEDFSNAVQLEFSVESANQDLSLKAVTLVGFTGDQNPASGSTEGEWPLALNQGEAFDAPMLVWRTIALQQDDSGPFIEIKDAFLKFVLFDYLWNVPLKPEDNSEGAVLRFPQKQTSQTQTNCSHKYSIPVSDQALYLLPKLLTLEINLQTKNHTVELDLDIQLGSTDSNRNSFEAKVQFPILKDGKPTVPIWQTGHLLGVIPLTVANHQLTTNHQAFQFHWETASVTNAPQLLPGIMLDTEPDGKPSLPGFVALTFDLQSPKQPESSTDESDIPLLTLTSAFVEALLSCKWGEFLQTDVPEQATSNTTDRKTQVFGSSAGDLICSYTADWSASATANQAEGSKAPTWQETLIFNGMLEIKNLISWPEELEFDSQATTPTVLLPSLPKNLEQRILKHRRHSLRILLNQHVLPCTQIIQNHDSDSQTIFDWIADAAWEFLAVVEHQLIDSEIQQTANGTPKIKGDRRWTVTQPIRCFTPVKFKQELEKLNNTYTPDPATGIDKSGSGFFDPVFRKALIDELDQLCQQPHPLLLIEASAHFWLNQTPLTTLSPTTLQFLSNGAQLGILSSPDHYSPSDPIHPDWLLLTLPFLGRLQLSGNDGLDQSSSQPQVSSPLQVDPILCLKHYPEPAKLALMLATWQPTTSDGTPIRLAISSVDTATGRTWARLDPLALQESWFRLQHPVAEPPTERLQSVIAAQPNSPARLSRLAALKQNIASYRQAVPPLPTNHSGSQLPEPAQAIKTGPLRRTGLPILALPQEGMLPADLQVLYLFQGGSGSRVMDRSGVGEPLDLDLMERSGGQEPPWRWEGDGLRLLRSSILITNRPATKLINACRSTQELTIEVWLELDADQTRATRLAPIVSLSNDPNNRYFTLSQGGRDNQSGGDLFSIRLRTDSTTHSDGTRSAAGTPLDRTAPIATDPGSAKAGLSHIVFTRQSNGLMKVYIDGQERASNTLLNGLFPVYHGQNSDQTFRLGLGNEILGNSPWLGKYYRVAIYSRALTVAEVQSQFSQGYVVWAASGLQIATSKLTEAPVTLSRYAAATLLTTTPPSAQLQAQSLAISPYLGLMFQPAAKNYTPSLVSAELLCLNRATKTLRPIASHLWEVPSSSTPEELLQTSIDWAKEIHARLCPESPVAVLRFREIRRLASETDPFAAPIVTSYSYQIISDLAITELPLKRVFQLRSQLPQLRFSEGQWGGTSLPSQFQPSELAPSQTIQLFELAPPQTIGVQPIYLTERPGQGAWPWGLSSLRVSVRHAAQGVTGRLDATSNRTLWWQAPQYTVQYRTNTNGIAAGLPDMFRARAISSLLPTALKPQMPAIDMTETFAIRTETRDQKTVVKSKAESHWQAVLPSMMRYLLIGDRPGVFFNLRNQLLRQGGLNPVATTPDSLQNSAENFSNHSVFVSGSVPVQHRMPRPVPLPPNPEQGRPDSLALQPWASYFHPTRTVWVTDSPADEAFLAADLIQNKPARGLRLRLTEPSSGAIPANWDGYLKFKLASYRGAGNQPTPLVDWEVSEMSALVGNQTFTFIFIPYDLKLWKNSEDIPQTGQASVNLVQSPNSTSTAPTYQVRIFDAKGVKIIDKANIPSQDLIPAHLKQLLEDTFRKLAGVNSEEIRTVQNRRLSPVVQEELVQTILNWELEFRISHLPALKDQLALLADGSPLSIQARVRPKPDANGLDDGFQQSLSFALRLTSDRTLPLPLRPQFLQFEDPEYNRQLASSTAHSFSQITVPGSTQLVGLRLATDRREYNPDTLLTWRYDWADTEPNPAFKPEEIDAMFQARRLQIKRIRKGGEALLSLPSSSPTNLNTGVLYQLSLSQLTQSDRGTTASAVLQPNDILQLTLQLFQDAQATQLSHVLVLTVNIVANSVQPVPNAAYGLLRRNPDGSVECVRFAWGVMPDRVDLVNPNDLRTEVVRRRALFRWIDTKRSEHHVMYEIQKITQTGSTNGCVAKTF